MTISWFDVTGDKANNPEDDLLVWFYTDRGERRIGKYRRCLDGRVLSGSMSSGWESDEKFYGRVIKWGYIETPPPPMQTEFDKLAERWAKLVIESENRKNTIINLRCCVDWLRNTHPVVFEEMRAEFDTVNLCGDNVGETVICHGCQSES